MLTSLCLDDFVTTTASIFHRFHNYGGDTKDLLQKTSQRKRRVQVLFVFTNRVNFFSAIARITCIRPARRWNFCLDKRRQKLTVDSVGSFFFFLRNRKSVFVFFGFVGKNLKNRLSVMKENRKIDFQFRNIE